MTLQALASNELPSYIFYDTIHHHHSAFGFSDNGGACEAMSSLGLDHVQLQEEMPDIGHAGINAQTNTGILTRPGEGRKKRSRRPRSCKNEEEAESQRMTHIAVERNRRRLMNEHLAVLRSLMPESYIQKGDQASIVGGAIDFVKELEQLVQSLEAHKRTLLQGKTLVTPSTCIENLGSGSKEGAVADSPPPFAQFFAYPQYLWLHPPRDCPPVANQRPAALADIEVTLIETHANLRILSPKRPRQLVRMVAGLQTLRLIILHLNVTTLDSVVLYSLSVKVEDGCNLTSGDDIAAAVHHMLSLMESERTAS